MRLLELFSGTGSVSQSFRATGWEVLSLDLDPKSPADIHCDILDWDYTAYEPGYFDAVWASPPCTQYSVARTTGGSRDLAGADAIVQRTLDVILWFCPNAWWIENPWTGLLKSRQVVAGLPYFKVSYCMYGSPYRKNTALWSNVAVFEPLVCNRECGSWRDGRHAKSAQRGPAKGNDPVADRCSLNELHALPRRLCDAIERATRAWIGVPIQNA